MKSALKEGKNHYVKRSSPKTSRNFMDADGSFLKRGGGGSSHYCKERLGGDAGKLSMAFHAVNREAKMFCFDTGSNTFLVNYFMPGASKLEKLEIPIIIDAAAVGAELIVRKINECGNVRAIRYCKDAAANLIPIKVINDCGVSVHLFKIAEGNYACHLECKAGTIGGDEEEKFIIEADRENELWWIPEARVLDIIHRGGWPVAEYDRIQNELRVDKALAAAQMIKDQLPYEAQDRKELTRKN